MWRKQFFSFGLLLVVFYCLYWQGYNHLWRGHLEIDTWNYFLKIEDFIKTGSFFTAIGNEILPATTMFIFLPSLFIRWHPFLYSNYLMSFFMVVFLVLGLHWYLVQKNSSFWQTLMFLSLLLIFGPINLFRFDGLAAFLVVLGLILFRQDRFGLAGLFLGLTTAVKIYPIIFLPYLLLIFFSRRQFKSMSIFLLIFGLAIINPILIFINFGGQISQIIEGLNFHNLKYVSIESLPGSFLTLWNLLTLSYPPRLIGGYGVWGITTPLIAGLGLDFFNRFWLVPVAIFYLFLTRQKKLLKEINFGIIFSLTILFLVFSKNLHAQYIWWFMSIFPFIRIQAAKKWEYLLMFILLIFISVFNQIMYPLFYTQFFVDFYQHNQHYEVYYALLIRNILIVYLLVISLKYAFQNKTA